MPSTPAERSAPAGAAGASLRIDRTHRRLAVVLSLTALAAFTGGAGFQPATALVAASVLVAVLIHPPGYELGRRLERLLGPLAVVLVLRVAAHAILLGDDVVIPVVDLLLLLLCGEALRPPEAANEVRIYALSFALLLASTAYRPGVLFAAAFVAYVVVASVVVPVGILRRNARRFGVRDVPVDRVFVATSLALSLVTLLASAAVFLVFPRVSRAGPGRADVLARSVAGFSDQVSIGEHGSTISANPEVVLRVEFPDGLPRNPGGLHWRGRSYDRFDGLRWTRTRGIRPSAPPTSWYEERWGGPTLRQEIYAAPLDVRVLFALHPLVAVDSRSGIQPMFDNVGDYSYWGSGTPAYTAHSRYGRPPADSLRRAEDGFMPDRARYLQLPRLPDRIHALADSLTRGEPTRYDRVVTVESWLQSAFRYTRELPATAGETGLDHFLFERRAGHCEYFSTAMVVLLRSIGIHARNVNGFLGGAWNPGGSYLAVTQNEAHSWVEVWFPDYGWVTFDPTPSGVGGGEAARAWLWPGRFFLDGLQHRWSKWVLDYSFTEQSGALRRLERLVGSTRRSQAPSRAAGTADRLWAALLVAVVGLVLVMAWARRARRRPETVPYLRLLRRARRLGVVGPGPVTPLELARRIERRAPGAGAPARELVRLYLEARFSGRPVPASLSVAMAEALADARRALR
jgi:transglutaminase-like putative cysteine protease